MSNVCWRPLAAVSRSWSLRSLVEFVAVGRRGTGFGVKSLLLLLRFDVRVDVEETEESEDEDALDDAEHEEKARDTARGHQPDVEQMQDGARDLHNL